MDARETVRLATRSLRGHKLRSALTVLGIVIGIAAVVTFVTFGASLRADVVGQIGDSSANNIYLLSSAEDSNGPPAGFRPVFTETDIETVRALEGVESVIPQGQVAVSTIGYGNRTIAQGTVTSTTPAAFDGATFLNGTGLTAGQNEIVLNEQATRLFGGNLTVGDRLNVTFRSVGTRSLTVVGVVNRTGAQLPFETFSNQPRFYVPTDPYYDTVVETPRGTEERAYPQVTVVADPAQLTSTQDRIEAYFPDSDAAQRQPPDYELTAQTGGDIADSLEELVNRLTRFVTGLALISLLVGAIGIANIMLVSVTERTREIGIMKAVGARNRDVLVLFLVESGLLGVLGALIALPVGLAGGWAATSYADIPLTLAPEWFAVAIVVGILVGVVAGLYPAWRAARVDPIDALRRE
jgi:putative ABC transport system permease protein